MSNLTPKIDQRLYIDREQLIQLETSIRLRRHVERYALLRQFAKGVICDAACGCGYGSYLLQTNPDVTKVIGLDCDPNSIQYAKQEYSTEKTEFHVTDLNDWNFSEKIDMLISVETIEHIRKKETLPMFVDRNSINYIILTYPSKKTTHYNVYHHHDYQLPEILKLFDKFLCHKYFNWEYEFDVVFLIRQHI